MSYAGLPNINTFNINTHINYFKITFVAVITDLIRKMVNYWEADK